MLWATVITVSGSITWVSLPKLLTMPAALQLVFQAAPFLAIGIAVTLSRPGIGTASDVVRMPRQYLPLAAFLTVWALSVVRDPVSDGRLADLAVVASVVFFAKQVFDSFYSPPFRRLLLQSVAAAPVVFVAANIVLWLLSVEPAYQTRIALGESAAMLGALGIEVGRVSFPLEPGINTFGLVAALGLTTSAAMSLGCRGNQRTVWVFGSILSLVGVLLTDSRGPVFFSFLAILTVAVLRSDFRRARWASLLVVVSPIVAPLLLAELKYLPFGSAREGVVGKGREYIWSTALSAFDAISPSTLFGWGRHGQIGSGVGLLQSGLWGLKNQEQSLEAYASHNYAIQTMLDSGLVGLAVGCWLLSSVLLRLGSLCNAGSAEAVALVAGVIAVVMMGFLESTLTWASPETLQWLLLVSIAAASDWLVMQRSTDIRTPS